jgi:hypothetical protein
MRSIKALGLAFVAVLAMSAVVASAAHASTLTTFPEGKTVKISGAQVGTQEFVLTDNSNLKTTCTVAKFEPVGTYTTGAETIEVHPVYEKCTAFGINATISTVGCNYLIHAAGAVTGGFDGFVDVTCGSGAIVITTLTCEVKVDTQTKLNTLTATNSGQSSPETGMDVLLHANVQKIKYTVIKDGIGCPLRSDPVPYEGLEGDLTGDTTVTATDSTTGAAVGITIH